MTTISNISKLDFVCDEFSQITPMQELAPTHLDEIIRNQENKMCSETAFSKGLFKSYFKNKFQNSKEENEYHVKGLINPQHPDITYPYPGKKFSCHCGLDADTIRERLKKIGFFFEGRYKKK